MFLKASTEWKHVVPGISTTYYNLSRRWRTGWVLRKWNPSWVICCQSWEFKIWKPALFLYTVSILGCVRLLTLCHMSKGNVLKVESFLWALWFGDFSPWSSGSILGHWESQNIMVMEVWWRKGSSPYGWREADTQEKARANLSPRC